MPILVINLCADAVGCQAPFFIANKNRNLILAVTFPEPMDASRLDKAIVAEALWTRD